ncbi:tellurium resistance protein [Acinetobacter proteolyticus]|uniref:VWA domain-containing protein n=1 Tax=Acinetobacter proteolyticus TaxID=1776741 RepID=UPI0008631FD3|nr:VWA domain-containing protein [Acinetobacter proteolyticus]OEY94856.1 tellurium resistance protein [Acinetobacter proteolyticus]
MLNLVRGQKIKLTDVLQGQSSFYIQIQYQAAFDLDIASFGLDPQYRLSDERYMTFYNQPETPCQAVRLIKNQNKCSRFLVDSAKLPASIQHLVLTAAIDGQNVMSQLQQATIQILNVQLQPIAELTLDGSIFDQERATMLIEIYRKDSIWRLAAIGQGFNAGLAALIQHFGGEVAEEPTLQQTTPAAPQSNIDLKKKLSLQKAEKTGNASIIDLTKKSLVQLEKKNLLGVTARVALVLDASGSMDGQYRRGDVQKVVNRLMPLAIHFDDDGSFECWAFAAKTTQLDDVTLNNVNDFINTTQRGWKNWQVGARYNEEIPAIEAVINYFQKFKDQIPTYVLFISDGGVGSRRQMQKILSQAAKLPIFWQFVGIGGRDYGALEKLDEMSGRIVDNCNFFSLDRIDSVSDERLYELLLQEFPDWLNAAKQHQIVRN